MLKRAESPLTLAFFVSLQTTKSRFCHRVLALDVPSAVSFFLLVYLIIIFLSSLRSNIFLERIPGLLPGIVSYHLCVSAHITS